jgi:hypothetical protein
MTDRELLELAAKAIGEKCDQLGANAFGLYKPKEGYMQPYIKWNPLTDDGDALRLAVKLSISISDDYLYPNGEHVIRVGCSFGDTLYGDSEVCGDDPYAATRRCITRAAAEIGKAMP